MVRRVCRGARASGRWVGVFVITLSALVAAPAAAETPSEVVAETTGDGIYIANTRRNAFDVSMFQPTVDAAAREGIRMIVAVPFDPVPTTTAFARRIREASDADVALVFGPDGVLGADVSEDYEDDEVRALSAARERTTPEGQAEAFLVGLTTEPVRERPEIIDTVVRWIVILLVVLIAAALLEQGVRQAKRARRRYLLRRARQEADQSGREGEADDVAASARR